MEHYKILVYETAETDIRNAVGHISKTLREPNTARNISMRIQETIMSLCSMPERFQLVHDNYLASQGVRIASAGNYLIFYIVDHKEHRVDILRVLYGKRNWIEILRQEPL